MKLGWALDLCITGRWIDAREALFVGLVAEVVSNEMLDRRAHELALKLGHLPRGLVTAAKLAVWDGLDLPLAEGLALESRLAARMRIICPAER
jgi:enoyl-CoA hydratase/carnithine racemase